MNGSTVYSIGHGRKKMDEFIAELKKNHVKYILDIRTKPFSKWSPQFNQLELQCSLDAEGIKYVFMGDALGGLPSDRSCYNKDGKVEYSLLKEKEFFKRGLERLVLANIKKIKVAIMCSEAKPEECHRSKLIGEELLINDISIKHILSGGAVETQEVVIGKITKGRNTVDLFGKTMSFSSRKAY